MSAPVPFQPSVATTVAAPKKEALVMDNTKKQPILAGVRVVLTYLNGDGTYTHGEVVVSPNDYDIDSHNLSQERKIAKAKDEDGNLIGFEPTGEYTLLLKLKYHKKD